MKTSSLPSGVEKASLSVWELNSAECPLEKEVMCYWQEVSALNTNTENLLF